MKKNSEYRGARRNAAKGTVWKGAATKRQRVGPVYENSRFRRVFVDGKVKK